jgi:ABC-type polysaccharide/polyol phosphate export permease
MAEFKRRYAGTSLGYVWAVLRPLSFFAVLYVFVTVILQKFAGEIESYPVLLLLNITLFQFFVESVQTSTRSLERGALIRKVRLPQVVLPFSNVLTTALSYAIALAITFVWMLAYGIEPMWTWLLLPVVLLALLTITCCTCLLASSLFVRSRDVGQIVPLVTRVLFYLTPVLFPIEVLPEDWLVKAESFNPLAPLFVEARVWIIDPDAPGWFEFVNGPLAWLPFFLFAAVCVLGCVVFARRARHVAEEI